MADAAEDSANRILWRHPVVVSTSADSELKAIATEFAQYLNCGPVGFAVQNPAACFWIEIWRPMHAESVGFLLHIEKTGGRLTASDANSLREALDYLKTRATSDEHGAVYLPGGISTNFDVQNVNLPDDSRPPGEAAEHNDTSIKPVWPRNDLRGLSNFAMISDALCRGAQPTAEGFSQLQQLGIKTVVNLRQFHSDRWKMKGLNFKYIHIRCKAWRPEEEDVVKFLRIVTDPAMQPVFVHCQHGADRTGMMVAAYRIAIQGWTPDNALVELPRFGFHTIFPRVPRYIESFAVDEIRRKIAPGKGD